MISINLTTTYLWLPVPPNDMREALTPPFPLRASLIQGSAFIRLFGAHLDHSWDQCKSDEKFFWRGGGRGIGVQWPKMTLECFICDPRSQKISGWEPPDPPLKRIANTCIHYWVLHYTLSGPFQASWSSARQSPVNNGSSSLDILITHWTL